MNIAHHARSIHSAASFNLHCYRISVCAFRIQKNLIVGLRCLGLTGAYGGLGRDKKDAEASKTASSPYKRTAETVFGGRKSENIILPFEGIREDSDIIQQISLH